MKFLPLILLMTQLLFASGIKIHKKPILGDAILTVKRNPGSFRVAANVNNIPNTPDATAGSLVLTGLGSTQHLMLCSECTTRLRFAFNTGSLPASSSAYDGIIPAAPASSFICFTADDIQLSGKVYIWSDGSAISASCLVYGNAW